MRDLGIHWAVREEKEDWPEGCHEYHQPVGSGLAAEAGQRLYAEINSHNPHLSLWPPPGITAGSRGEWELWGLPAALT